MKSIRFAVAAAGLAAASVASAASITLTTSDLFVANLAPGSYTEQFAVSSFSGNLSASFSGGAFSYNVSAPTGLYGNGVFIGTIVPDELLTVTFTGPPVTAIGGNFWATNFSDVFQLDPISLTLSDGTSTTFTPSSETVGSFRGFLATLPITSLTIVSTASTYAGMDNFIVGVSNNTPNPIPEPGTWALIGLGMAGMLLARRKASV